MRARGFTLIELLMVLLLIAIIASLAMMNLGIGDADPRLEKEARRLTAVLELATESAVIQSRELGLVIDADGYYFAMLESGEWLPLEAADDRVLRAHGLPEDIRLEWVADGLPGEREPGDDEDGGHRPALLLLSSGEITPFRMVLTWRDGDDRDGWLLEGDLIGSLTLRRQEDPRP
ncbi:MAG: type II secretion system minor pseudopilin GspH [Aquisalimonadaceae bacterium]